MRLTQHTYVFKTFSRLQFLQRHTLTHARAADSCLPAPPPHTHTHSQPTQVTTETGIRRLVPAADIDDYVFEPCGYSMNGILGGGFITIHITPEEVS